MIIKSPCCITSRLCAGVKVGDSFISIDYAKHWHEPDGRTTYRYWIDAPGIEHYDDDLHSGCKGGALQSGLVTLLGFLSAAAEAYAYMHYAGRRSENLALFPDTVSQWAYAHSDEISMLACELEETDDVIAE
jgi:hypothetical protein